MIQSIKIWKKVTLASGSNTYILRIDKGADPWSAPLSQEDWNTTDTIPCEAKTINSTGWFSWEIAVSDLVRSEFIDEAIVYERITSTAEGQQTTRQITFASQDNSNPDDRPYIEIIGEKTTHAIEKDLGYRVVKSQVIDKGAEYRVARSLKTSLGDEYRVKTIHSITLGLEYALGAKIAEPKAITKGLTYALRVYPYRLKKHQNRKKQVYN